MDCQHAYIRCHKTVVKPQKGISQIYYALLSCINLQVIRITQHLNVNFKQLLNN